MKNLVAKIGVGIGPKAESIPRQHRRRRTRHGRRRTVGSRRCVAPPGQCEGCRMDHRTYGRARPGTVRLTGQADDQSEAFGRRSHDIASCQFGKQCRLIEMAVIQTDKGRALASCSASDDRHVPARRRRRCGRTHVVAPGGAYRQAGCRSGACSQPILSHRPKAQPTGSPRGKPWFAIGRRRLLAAYHGTGLCA